MVRFGQACAAIAARAGKLEKIALLAEHFRSLMATGLTFGTISSLYGLTHHYINQAQYTALVTVVILTAIMPTLVAQALFKPAEEPEEMEAEVP
jgi:hypothetical protein